MKTLAYVGLMVVLGAGLSARQAAVPMSYADARPILQSVRQDLWPEPLQGKTPAQVEAAWPQWVLERDTAIRARVAQGDEDSVVFLLLFGTSFTKAPRATTKELSALAARPAEGLAALRQRIADFVTALASPGSNERIRFASEVIARAGLDPATEVGRTRVREHLEQRALAIGKAGVEQLSSMLNEPAAMSTIFRERGLASDTTITIDFGIERTLEAMKADGVLGSGAVRRVAIVGPGLDFIDKQSGYDFYPQQTIQPFAAIDSLLRFGLADAKELEVVAFDLSPRVIDHLETARARAARGAAYPLVLPRDLDRSWTPGLIEYWQRLGNWIEERGTAATQKPATPAAPPAAGRVEVRGVAVRPDVLRATTARDLNVVLQRMPASAGAPFDLVIATNILLYYDVFEQSLAAANIAAMLRPGGLLLTNTRIVELPGIPLGAAGHTDVTYTSQAGVGDTGDRIMWYQKP
jgi:hypothetical protein